MQLFEPMCGCSHCRGEKWSVFGGWFSWSLGRQLANKWLCTTQNWHVQFFGKNRQSFAWKCFVRDQLLLDLAHLKEPFLSDWQIVWDPTRTNFFDSQTFMQRSFNILCHNVIVWLWCKIKTFQIFFKICFFLGFLSPFLCIPYGLIRLRTPQSQINVKP